MQLGTFASLEKKGQPSEEYPVEKLAKNLNNKDIMLFVGSNDALAAKSDFKMLLDVLPKSTTVVEHIDDYNHNDYMWAHDAHGLINEKGGLLKFIADHQW